MLTGVSLAGEKGAENTASPIEDIIKNIEKNPEENTIPDVIRDFDANYDYYMKNITFEQKRRLYMALQNMEHSPRPGYYLRVSKIMIKLMGKRGLMASYPFMFATFKVVTDSKGYMRMEDTNSDPLSTELSKHAVKALNENEILLFFDNGDHVRGVLDEFDNTGKTFISWVSQEKWSRGRYDEISIKLPPEGFYRLTEVEAKTNPKYKSLKQSIEYPIQVRAVRASITWGSFHQNRKTGKWDTISFTDLCKGGQCDGKGSVRFDIGATGLMLSRFLLAGHNHRTGKYKRSVRRGVKWLRSIQQEDGSFDNSCGVYHGLQTAMAAYPVVLIFNSSQDSTLKKMTEPLLKHIHDTQNPDGGWPAQKGEPSTATTTAFAVMTLHAARKGFPEFGNESLLKGVDWFQKAMPDNSSVLAVSAGGEVNASVVSTPYARLGMAYAALYYGGVPKDSPKMKNLAALILKDAESRTDFKKRKPGYYLEMYFNSIAMYYAGGKELEKWKKLIIDNMFKYRRRERKCPDGSYDPSPGKHLFDSRVSSTALARAGAAFLYQISMDEFEKKKKSLDWDDDSDFERPAPEISWDKRCKYLYKIAARSDSGITPDEKKTALDMLKHDDPFVRGNAVRALTKTGQKDALPEIEKLKDDKSPFVNAMVKEAFTVLNR